MEQMPKALLLAAGLGSRLKPLTEVLPKCLMPINGEPLLGLWLERLCSAGISDVVINLHRHAGLVRDYVERSPFARFVTLAEEPRLLGTAGTLARHREHFAGAPVLLAHADNLSLFAPERFVATHRARPPAAAMTMMTFRTDAPQQCGIVKLDSQGIVVEFHEKSSEPHGDLANAAVYIVEREVIDHAHSLGRPVLDFSTEVVPHFLGRIHTFHNGAYHRDIGTLVDLIRAQFEFPLARAKTSDKGMQSWCGLMDGQHDDLAQRFLRSVSDALLAGARRL
jgi:mannose-1-phosphate guanylyltransferase